MQTKERSMRVRVHVLVFVGEGIFYLFVQMMWSENNITLEKMRSAYEKGGKI